MPFGLDGAMMTKVAVSGYFVGLRVRKLRDERPVCFLWLLQTVELSCAYERCGNQKLSKPEPCCNDC